MTHIFWIEEGKLAGSSFPSVQALEALYDEGFRVLVPLETRGDIPELETMGYQVRPIHVEDFTAPTIRQLEEFNRIVEEAADQPVLVHCLGGYGRTGTMLAAWLIRKRSFTAGDAISLVRERRPGAVEVPEQIRVLKSYERYITREREQKEGSP